ncbi:TOBE domain-containing protein [Aquincola sp. S2]|uniref:TOBE domain-containing protein n=1 Tax=Pseudaquabacterium terrae TaxID=2732868 RepID=A0ABX2ET11_9BURK|nr:TOBE domain-containing protein [Aquabacterium terrae]
MRRPRKAPALGLDGAVWLTIGGTALGGRERVELLRAVAETGSITRAAQAVGLSYKGAWEAIEAMNGLAREPLVERRAGGRGGGATQLTPHGAKLVERFGQLDAVHRRFVTLLEQGSIDLDRDFSLLGILNMRTSARNQFVGTVSAIRAGAVNDEVELTLPGGTRIVAQVTPQSTAALGLRTQATVIALLKSSAVLVATELEGARLSARNQLAGTVRAVTPGAVNAEVEIELDSGDGRIVAIVTQPSVEALGLAPGVRATAVFDVANVILAVTA